MKKIFMATILFVGLGYLSAQHDGNDSGSRFTFLVKRLPESFQGATITGLLVDARTMQPLRGAIVTAASAPSTRAAAPLNIGFRTGADGTFVLRGVAPGIVNFLVSKAGYVPGPYASVRPAAEGERIDNVLLTVPPGSSLSGRVLDESGQPVARMPVMVSASSDPSLLVRAQVSRGVGMTDDDGQYWVGGLAAGEYSVTVGSVAEAPSIVSFGDVSGTRNPTTDRAAPGQTAKIALTAGEDLVAPDLVIRFKDRFIGRQPIDSGTATITGQVVDSRGAGIPHAAVSLRVIENSTLAVTTRADADGRFQFHNVPPGSFALSTAQPMAIDALTTIRPVRLQIAAGTRSDHIVLTAGRGGTISGTLTDEFGGPVLGAVIVMTQTQFEQVGDLVSIVTRPDGVRVSARAAGSDARGRYRITGLPPGAYLVSIAAGDPTTARTAVHFADHAGQIRQLAKGPVFYPGVPTVSQASKIVVSEGSDINNIDVTVTPLLVANINVTMTSPRPVSEIQLHQILLDDRLPMLEKTTKLTGSTVTLDARAGRYRLFASAEVASNADTTVRLWSSVDVDADPLLPTMVNMVLEPGANISGRIVFEGKATNRQGAGAWLVPMMPLPGIRIPTIAGNSMLTVATGEFSIEGVMPGRYAILAGGAERNRSGWMLRTATVGGRDVLDEPIELRPGDDISDVRLTVTDRVTELAGTVADATDKPGSIDWVVVFSADKKHWWPGSRRLRAVRPEANGRYTVRALPPGPYIVTLVPDPTTQDDLLAKLPALAAAGNRVTLADGERKVQDLRKVK